MNNSNQSEKNYRVKCSKCGKNWTLNPNHMNPKPMGREVGHCYCGRAFTDREGGNDVEDRRCPPPHSNRPKKPTNPFTIKK